MKTIMSVPLTLYRREGCHLCDIMQAQLATYFSQVSPAPDIDIVDVDSSPDLAQRYGLKVPVLTGVDGIICYGQLDDDSLHDYLRGEG